MITCKHKIFCDKVCICYGKGGTCSEHMLLGDYMEWKIIIYSNDLD